MSSLMGSNKRIILLGGLARSGKNATGEILFSKLKATGKKVEMVAFAEDMKRRCEAAFGPIIKRLEEAYGIKIEGDFRENKSEFHRSILQQVGTNFVREANPGFWVEQLLNYITRSDNEYFIVTDFRFPNEYFSLLRSFEVADIITIQIIRDSVPRGSHVSENSLTQFKFDCIIRNDGDLKALEDKVERIMVTEGILA